MTDTNPCFAVFSAASQFVVYTDASDVGLNAILEQARQSCYYLFKTCTKQIHNRTMYSVIQKEYLAIVNATKQSIAGH